MNDNFIRKSQLREKLVERDKSLGFEDSTIKKKVCCLSRLLRYMNEHDLDMYTYEVGEAFLSETCSDSSLSHYLRNNLSYMIVILDDICNGIICNRRHISHDYPLVGSMAQLVNSYLESILQEQRVQSKTAEVKRCILSRFTQKMSAENIGWDTLKFYHIVDFLSSTKNTTPQVHVAIHGLLQYAYEHGVIALDLVLYVKAINPHRKEKLPSYYSKEEVLCVEESIDRRSPIGKRDYAIVLLASRLGLRSSDIRTLKFKNLDWDKNEIDIIQYKTGQRLILPLLSEVGAAIVDYIRYARPACDYKTLFLTCSHPYKPIETSGISSIVRGYFTKSGVDCKGKHVGPHALRHSLATTMLSNGTSLPIISDVLGHASSESTMYYLGIDVASLIKCSLDVPPVDDSFYIQKGGVLYE